MTEEITMAVKLELYRVFHEVARMGNISAAAQNLFISQSAVSQSIKWKSSCRCGSFRAARRACI